MSAALSGMVGGSLLRCEQEPQQRGVESTHLQALSNQGTGLGSVDGGGILPSAASTHRRAPQSH